MIKGLIQYIDEDVAMSGKVYDALMFLQTLNIDELPLGRSDINQDMFMQVLMYETQDASDFRFETHTNYLDLHYIIEGEEEIQLVDVDTLLKKEEYLLERDLQYYGDEKVAEKICLKKGNYIFIHRYEAHKTNCWINKKATKVKKIVIKIRMNE